MPGVARQPRLGFLPYASGGTVPYIFDMLQSYFTYLLNNSLTHPV